MKWTFWILFIAWTCFAVEPEIAPFWKTKEKYRRQVYSERAVVVLVSARPSKLKGFKEELYMQGAGVVNAPLDLTYGVAKKFEDYPKMSAYVKSAQFDPATSILRMHTAAYGYETHLKMRLEFQEGSSDRKDIRFQVLEGVFKDLNGVLRLDKINAKRTEISLTGLQGYSRLPIPKFFVEFGMEVALQKMATRMRAFVEESLAKKGAI